jgi:hypothetical protein
MSKRVEKPWCKVCQAGDAGKHTCDLEGPIETVAYFRERRGKLVMIPEEWVGQTTHPQTIRNRDSKRPEHALRYDRRWSKTSGAVDSPHSSRETDEREAIEDSDDQ